MDERGGTGRDRPRRRMEAESVPCASSISNFRSWVRRLVPHCHDLKSASAIPGVSLRPPRLTAFRLTDNLRPKHGEPYARCFTQFQGVLRGALAVG